eukprot:gb/GECH01004973.1/.p1 GENE.gb/GECH01004973.1/~~gb/GECH01004973.1/.p1  ORF type:complete len:528 (+),score=169.78 gb/GECH01004973.1/:1-1584(+)
MLKSSINNCFIKNIHSSFHTKQHRQQQLKNFNLSPSFSSSSYSSKINSHNKNSSRFQLINRCNFSFIKGTGVNRSNQSYLFTPGFSAKEFQKQYRYYSQDIKDSSEDDKTDFMENETDSSSNTSTKAGSNKTEYEKDDEDQVLWAQMVRHMYVSGFNLDQFDFDNQEPKTQISQEQINQTAENAIAAEKIGRASKQFFAGNIRFKKSCVALDHLPKGNVPEIGFVGRSNVGKSSLMNAVFGKKKKLVKTSKRPGATQKLNFFHVSSQHDKKGMHMVDMPGYGYAEVPERVRGEWFKLMKLYLLNSKNLQLLFILIDARRSELQPADKEFMDFIVENNVPHQFVLTKIDKSSDSNIQRIMAKILSNYSPKRDILLTSAARSLGIDSIKLASVHASYSARAHTRASGTDTQASDGASRSDMPLDEAVGHFAPSFTVHVKAEEDRQEEEAADLEEEGPDAREGGDDGDDGALEGKDREESNDREHETKKYRPKKNKYISDPKFVDKKERHTKKAKKNIKRMNAHKPHVFV